MKRVCTACHAVSDIDGDTCPRCGGSAVTLDAWRDLRTRVTIPNLQADRPIDPAGPADGVAAASNPKPGVAERGDGTAFVLGMFLSFLCFAIVFITVYVVLDWLR